MTTPAAYRLARAIRPQLETVQQRSASIPVCWHQSKYFSSTPSQQLPRERKKNGDGNKNRGLSAIRGTGLRKRQTLSVKIENLAVPVASPDLPPLEVRENHGLWEFFRDSKALIPPDDMSKHGRSWTYQEAIRKNFDELHALWWACVKERNWISTSLYELHRTQEKFNVEKKKRENEANRAKNIRKEVQDQRFYGFAELKERDKTLKRTMATIKSVLTQRWYAWEDARQLVSNGEDSEISYSAESDKWEYLPQVVDEEDYAAESDAQNESETTSAGQPGGEVDADEEDVARIRALQREQLRDGSARGGSATTPPRLDMNSIPSPARAEHRLTQ